MMVGPSSSGLMGPFTVRIFPEISGIGISAATVSDKLKAASRPVVMMGFPLNKFMNGNPPCVMEKRRALLGKYQV